MLRFRFFTTIEKVLIVVLSLVVIGTGYSLYSRFIRDHSELIPSDGGIFTEGLIGKPLALNPVLLTTNTVDRDLSQLIFSGLTKYNPHTGRIEDDLATSEKSKDNLSYTFTIVPDALWHDGEHVTADDVIFTYRDMIQQKDFPNYALHQMFSDIRVEKVTERVVRFRLSEPSSFFLASLTIGLLPKHLLTSVAPTDLPLAPFNQSPIGTGPFSFVSWTVNGDTHEINLRRFDRTYGVMPKIQTVIFRVFPTQDALLLSENTLTGFRLNSTDDPEKVLGSSTRFRILPYRLPQYSALFLNTASDILANKKVRIALQLATDKKKILALQPGAVGVESPVLESKTSGGLSTDLNRAQGALFDAQWYLPEKFEELMKKKKVKEAEKNTENQKKIQEIVPKDRANEPSQGFSVEFFGEADTWMSYILDKSPKVSLLLKKGEQKKLTVKKSVLLTTVGNAGGLKISINGHEQKKIGGNGEVAKNFLIDEKSLPAAPAADHSPPAQEPVKESPPAAAVKEPEPSSKSDELKKIRMNSDGKRLILKLVTAQETPAFLKIAEEVASQWLEVGVKVVIETYPLSALQDKIKARDYDILLFGQNLGVNLDAYPFWHSSQSGKGLNLSEYRSLQADNLLVDIRKTFDDRTKQDLLEKLKKLIADDTPAIFLSNPSQYYVLDSSVKNVKLQALSSHSDLLTDLLNWYLKEEYRLRPGLSIAEVFRWLLGW